STVGFERKSRLSVRWGWLPGGGLGLDLGDLLRREPFGNCVSQLDCRFVPRVGTQEQPKVGTLGNLRNSLAYKIAGTKRGLRLVVALLSWLTKPLHRFHNALRHFLPREINLPEFVLCERISLLSCGEIPRPCPCVILCNALPFGKA